MDIAVLDDDPARSLFLEQALRRSDHRCMRFRHGTALIDALHYQTFDALLLDRDHAYDDVREIVRCVRRAFGMGVPMMVLSDDYSEADVVGCLDDGADACLQKPVRHGELVARIEALARRAAAPYRRAGDTGRLPEHGDQPDLVYGCFRFELYEQRAWVHGKCVRLSPKEFALAVLLFRNLGALVTRRLMNDQVWQGTLDDHARTMDSHLSRVRGKLELWPYNGVDLRTVYRIGSRLDAA